jgi:hypothetical protein
VSSAAEIFASLEKAGITVSLDGGDLIARPSSAVTPEVVGLLRENKPRVLEALRSAVSSEEEVFELAREHFGLKKPRPHHGRDRRGLIAKWAREFGYVSIRDPVSGEWVSVEFKSAPEWAKWEARKRKELYKGGNRAAYELTARQMEKIWEEEHPREEEGGIVEEHPIE